MEAKEIASELIKGFENCHLTAYPDPGTLGDPWTIGWGNTKDRNGNPFKPGDKITQEEADYLLSVTIDRIDKHYCLTLPNYPNLNNYKQSALISFGFNNGWHWFNKNGYKTLSRVYANQEFDLVPDAFMLYINPGTRVEEGLRQRRQIEGEVWRLGLEVNQALVLTRTERPIHLINVAHYWRGFEHQVSSVSWLQEQVPDPILDEFAYLYRNRQGTMKVRILFPNVFRYYDNLPHQDLALNWLEDRISNEILEDFAKKWREPGPKRFEKPVYIDWDNSAQKISKYFIVGEVTKGMRQRQPQRGSQVEKNILEMAQKLDHVRESWGSAIGVTSWYRPPAINRAVGGASNSRHLFGDGVDTFPYNGRGDEYERFVDMIWEGGLGYGFASKRGFTHLDRGQKRRWDY